MSTAPDTLCTIPEAQAALKVSRGFLYTLRDRGALEFVKLGRAARIRQSSIDRLIQAGVPEEVEAVGARSVRDVCQMALAALLAWSDAAKTKDPERMKVAKRMRDEAIRAANAEGDDA